MAPKFDPAAWETGGGDEIRRLRGRCSPALLGFIRSPELPYRGQPYTPQTKVRAGWFMEATMYYDRATHSRHAYEAQTASATDKSRG